MRLAAAVTSLGIALGCAPRTNVPMTGGPYTYAPFETTCDFVESGALPSGKMWAKWRARGHRPVRCRGERATAGTCAPFSLTLDAPQLPPGASVTYSGQD